MPINTPVPAAQYVRMSTEHQQYSIENQKAAIQEYAEKHGFTVVQTYTDAGRTGVVLKSRESLRKLLQDVMGGQAPFNAILVYDVSRWGRFQDADEAAHYEFLCKSAGIPVRYCAEQFDNDGSMPNAIMKALKRTMAAEYSRELAVKVYAGQRRLTQLGFRVCGIAGFGLRRMMISADGCRRRVLKTGEHKAIKTDHTILVPGPKKEVECVRTIFSLAQDKRNTPRKIARELNRRKMRFVDGRPWDMLSVFRVLKNEKYIGCNIYGKTAKKLGGPARKVPRELWIRNPQAFAPVVEPEQFNRVQRAIQKRRTTPRRPDQYLLDGMRKVLAREGKLTEKILRGRGIFDHRTYCKRFGGVLRAYELIGYKPSPHAFKSVANQMKMRRLRADLLNRLKSLFPNNLRFVHLPGQNVRQVLEFDNQIRIAIHICRPVRTTVTGELRWLLRAQPLEAGYPCLICTVDGSLSTLLSFYVVPQFGDIVRKCKVLKEGHKWLGTGKKLEELSQLCEVAKAVVTEWQERDDTTTVGDVVITARTSTITIAKKEIMLPPIQSEIFKLLVRSAGSAVARAQLLHPFTGKEFPSAHLNAHICELRRRLGVLGKRIRTVKGQGYMYAFSETKASPDALELAAAS